MTKLGGTLPVLDAYSSAVKAFSWKPASTYNLATAICDQWASHEAATALVLVDERWQCHRYTFRYLMEQSNKLANKFIGDGFRRGEVVAVMLPASVEATIAHIGILKCGMVAAPLLVDDNPLAMMGRLELIGATAIVTDQKSAEVLAARRELAPELRKIYAVRRGGKITDHSLLEQLVSGCRSQFKSARTSLGEPAFIAFTSGSEGPPKGVVHTHQVVAGIMPSLLFTGIPTPSDLVWSHFDWGWLGGLLVPFGAWNCGCPVLLHNFGQLSPNRTIDLLRAFGVTRVSIAPTMLRMLQTGSGSAALPALTSITSGGEKLDSSTREWVRSRFRLDLSELYGQTECAAILGSGKILPCREGAIGKPPPGQSVRILSEDGEELPPGEQGLIAVKAPHPSMFLGYWKDPTATKAKFIGKFLKTGDIGFEDEDGYFWYVSRDDDLIKCAGRRIGPSEVEDAFVLDPAVVLAAAVGVPDSLTGEAIVVWIKLSDGRAASEYAKQALVKRVRQRLISYQMPSIIRWVTEIPLTVTGKVDRRVVRESERALQLRNFNS